MKAEATFGGFRLKVRSRVTNLQRHRLSPPLAGLR
jgi:hypothetical protein